MSGLEVYHWIPPPLNSAELLVNVEERILAEKVLIVYTR